MENFAKRLFRWLYLRPLAGIFIIAVFLLVALALANSGITGPPSLGQ